MPYFLSIGMSPNDFWFGDCSLARAYLKKAWIDRKNRNFDMWLQGLYVHDAVTVAIARGVAGDRRAKYPSEPYGSEQERSTTSKMERGKAAFEVMAGMLNASRTVKNG